MPKLSRKYIESLNLESNTYKPDWDDVAIDYTLPNGIILTGFIMLNNDTCEMDSLEGMDGYVYLTTTNQLDNYCDMTMDEVISKIKEEHPEADLSEFIEN